MFRVGFLIDGHIVSPYTAALIDWVNTEAGMEAVLFRVDLDQPHGRGLGRTLRSEGWRGLAARLAFAISNRIDARLSLSTGVLFDEVDLSSLNLRTVTVRPRVSTSGLIHWYADDVLAPLAQDRPDVMVRTGSGIQRGALLEWPRLGVLSHHHADNRINRGGPPAFWEVFERQPVTGYVIQRLSDELDGGDVLVRGEVPTRPRYFDNLASVYAGSINPFTELLARLSRGEVVTAERVTIHDGPVLRRPGFRQSLAMIRRSAAFVARRLIEKATGQQQHWRIALYKGDWQRATLRKASVIPARAGTFLADPFVTVEQGVPYIFAEEYEYRRGTGDIAAFRWIDEEKRFERLGIALSDGSHFSFPFLIRADGDLFMVPENTDSERLRLFRCVNFPLGWSEEAVLLDGIRAVDPIIFHQGSQWWMLVSERIAGSSANRLWLYGANNIRGPWSKCGEQPATNDAQRSRNGGLLRDGDELYRVAQSFDYGGYGSAANIYRIIEVSERGYREEFVQEVRPRFGRARGGHHLHNDGDWLAFDFWELRRPD